MRSASLRARSAADAGAGLRAGGFSPTVNHAWTHHTKGPPRPIPRIHGGSGFAGPTSPDTSRRSDRVLSPAMAQKRPSRRRPRDVRDEKENGAASGKQWPPTSAQPVEPRRPGARSGPTSMRARLRHGRALRADALASAAENALDAALLWSMVGAVALAGPACWCAPVGWWASAAGCALLIAVAILLLVLIVMSASFSRVSTARWVRARP